MNNEKPEMKGSIVKRGKGYAIKVSMGKDPTTGKYLTKWYTVRGTKEDAKKLQREILTQLDKGIFIQPGKITVGSYLLQWLADYAKPNISPRGYERYESIVRVHLIPSLGNIVLAQLQPTQIQNCYTTKLAEGLSPLTVKYLHTVLHKALATAIKRGLVSRNAADGVDLPRVRRKDMQTWDADEVNQFLEGISDSPYFALFHTALFTGMRRSELLALRWADIDFLYCQISVSRSLHHLRDSTHVFTQPKSAKSRRTVALSPAAILVLTEHKAQQAARYAVVETKLEDADLVFSTIKGQPLRSNTVSRAWTMLAERVGVKAIRMHDARHTHASLMLRQGVHPKIVQERLGHASIQITLDTYSHVAPGLQEAAAAQFDNLIAPKYNNKVVKNEAVQNN